MDYATARYKIAQKQLRQWKKNRGTNMSCSISTKSPIKIADRIDAKVAENRERLIETITAMKKILQTLRHISGSPCRKQKT